jgi:hypothetical protein
MVCNLVQLPSEFWMTIPVEDKKWLLDERKSQQQNIILRKGLWIQVQGYN